MARKTGMERTRMYRMKKLPEERLDLRKKNAEQQKKSRLKWGKKKTKS
jgi:hypothetical protein